MRHRATNTQDTPPWWSPGRSLPTPDLLGDLAVWRAANAIPDSDHRPTGVTQPIRANAVWQHDLDTRLGSSNITTLAAWTALVHHLVPATRHDDYTPQLAEHLAQLASTGIDAHTLLHTTTGAPLPDDHAASALWWRIQNHLPDLAARTPRPSPAEADVIAAEARDIGRRAEHELRASAPGPDRSQGPGMTR